MKKKVNSKAKKTSKMQKSFSRTMSETRKEMNKTSSLFSYFIHLRFIEFIYLFITRIVARPYMIIFGSIGMIVMLAFSYSVSQTLGYTVSGYEGLIGFFIGWLIGAVIGLFAKSFNEGKY